MRVGGALTMLSAVIAIMVTSGCAGARSADVVAGSRRIVVEVTNHHWQDMAIYARAGGLRIRLGTVTTFGRQRYLLPLSMEVRQSDIRLEAEAIGSDDRIQSETFMVSPGVRLAWTLEHQSGLSTQYVDSR